MHDLLARCGAFLTPKEVFGIGADVAGALAFLHGQGGRQRGLGDSEEDAANLGIGGSSNRKASGEGRTVVHGDVSARNVLLDSHGRAKLANLGLARALGSMGKHGSNAERIKATADMSAPMTTRRKGKSERGSSELRPYAAPETAQISEGRAFEPPADVYSLGQLLVHLCTAEQEPLPFEHDTAQKNAQVERAVAALAVPSARELLRWCRAFKPQERPSAADVLKELQRLRRHCAKDPSPFRTSSSSMTMTNAAIAATSIADFSSPRSAFTDGGRISAGTGTGPGRDGEYAAELSSSTMAMSTNAYNAAVDGVGVLGRQAVLKAISVETSSLAEQLRLVQRRLDAECGKFLDKIA